MWCSFTFLFKNLNESWIWSWLFCRLYTVVYNIRPKYTFQLYCFSQYNQWKWHFSTHTGTQRALHCFLWTHRWQSCYTADLTHRVTCIKSREGRVWTDKWGEAIGTLKVGSVPGAQLPEQPSQSTAVLHRGFVWLVQGRYRNAYVAGVLCSLGHFHMWRNSAFT